MGIDVKIVAGFSSLSASSSIKINENTNPDARIIPNPTHEYAEVIFTAAKTSPYTIELTDITGKILLFKKSVSVAGENREKINVQQFAAGLYFITLMDNAGKRVTIKVIKN